MEATGSTPVGSSKAGAPQPAAEAQTAAAPVPSAPQTLPASEPPKGNGGKAKVIDAKAA